MTLFKRRRVYCEDCRYIEHTESLGPPSCLHPSAGFLVRCGEFVCRGREPQALQQLCMYQNKAGKCKHFEEPTDAS